MTLQARIQQRKDRLVSANSNNNNNNNSNDDSLNNNDDSLNDSSSGTVVGRGSVSTDRTIDKITTETPTFFYTPNDPFLIPELVPTRVQVRHQPIQQQTLSSSSSSSSSSVKAEKHRHLPSSISSDKDISRQISTRLAKLRVRQDEEHQLYTVNKW